MKQFIIDLIMVASASLIIGVLLYAWLSQEVERVEYEYVDVVRVVPQVPERVDVYAIPQPGVDESMYLDALRKLIEEGSKVVPPVAERASGYDFTYSDNETMSAYEALVWIDGGIRSHQYYIDNPQFQNKGTGDTAFNERIIAQYKRARSLIERVIKEESK